MEEAGHWRSLTACFIAHTWTYICSHTHPIAHPPLAHSLAYTQSLAHAHAVTHTLSHILLQGVGIRITVYDCATNAS